METHRRQASESPDLEPVVLAGGSNGVLSVCGYCGKKTTVPLERIEAFRTMRRLLDDVTSFAPLGHHMMTSDKEWHQLLRWARNFLKETR